MKQAEENAIHFFKPLNNENISQKPRITFFNSGNHFTHLYNLFMKTYTLTESELQIILGLFERFMPKQVALDDLKEMAMYEAYHRLKKVSPLPTEEEGIKEDDLDASDNKNSIDSCDAPLKDNNSI